MAPGGYSLSVREQGKYVKYATYLFCQVGQPATPRNLAPRRWERLDQYFGVVGALPRTPCSAEALAADPDRTARLAKMDELAAKIRLGGILAVYADVLKFIEDVNFVIPPLTPPPPA